MVGEGGLSRPGGGYPPSSLTISGCVFLVVRMVAVNICVQD